MPSRGKDCSTCVYWQSYPLTQQAGVCENPESRYYDRGVSATGEACEYYALKDPVGRMCGECNGWYPLDTMPHMGECRNRESPRYRKAVFWDQTSGACYEKRSLEREEFAWCRTCRETVTASELDGHRSHDLFAGSSQLPVEDLIEFTLAGE